MQIIEVLSQMRGAMQSCGKETKDQLLLGAGRESLDSPWCDQRKTCAPRSQGEYRTRS